MAIAATALHRVRSVVLATIGLVLLTSPAWATLIAADLYAAGDQLITRDTSTGQEWLDLPLTTGLSVNQVLAGAGGWLAAGWRYATMDEVFSLWSSAGVLPTGVSPLPANIPGILELGGLLGVTGGSLDGSFAILGSRQRTRCLARLSAAPATPSATTASTWTATAWLATTTSGTRVTRATPTWAIGSRGPIFPSRRRAACSPSDS